MNIATGPAIFGYG